MDGDFEGVLGQLRFMERLTAIERVAERRVLNVVRHRVQPDEYITGPRRRLDRCRVDGNLPINSGVRNVDIERDNTAPARLEMLDFICLDIRIDLVQDQHTKALRRDFDLRRVAGVQSCRPHGFASVIE